ncbi:MAG: nicotinate-nucleotide--dimethylbenzimidazole phosphoribosyltransferase [Clostridiales Family XIII bacterium]|jgi:nicotinate-nucleotide--dimethylbenzimidazole phosphoribosyltransferase|nr:nicotinate-nucleotide--dimethylbenzimidazole phosphoribosyltransferase [Clostridiales Family XIII bacterium]
MNRRKETKRMDYKQAISEIRGADAGAAARARAYCDSLIKPPGSLGRLEELAVRLAGVAGEIHCEFIKPAVVVMAADNGVYAEGVAAAPQSFTLSQAVNMTRGICGVSALSAAAGAEVVVVDIGIMNETGCAAIVDRNVRRGTDNMAKGPAMARGDAEAAIGNGFEVASGLFEKGVDILGTGEMGIGNTTSTSACAIALLGIAPESAVGRGAGLDDEALARKVGVVKKALAVNAPDAGDPIDIVSKVGGLDIAGLVGCYLAAAYHRIPILVDGAISAVAALVASRLCPPAKDFMIATHRSTEPSYEAVSKELGLRPFLEMEMRLGEGSGCALAFPIVNAACAMMNGMGTFADISFDESVLVDIRETEDV